MDDSVACSSKSLDIFEKKPVKNEEEKVEAAAAAPPEPAKIEEKPMNMSAGASKLRSWLNEPMKIELSDKRVLVGIFLCTDRDANVILGSCSEYLPESERTHPEDQEPRILGLTMVPGKHIVSICVDKFKENYSKFDKENANNDVIV